MLLYNAKLKAIELNSEKYYSTYTKKTLGFNTGKQQHWITNQNKTKQSKKHQIFNSH